MLKCALKIKKMYIFVIHSENENFFYLKQISTNIDIANLWILGT
jgi:hypothetical protein